MSEIKESKTQGKTIHIQCPQCNVHTKHTVERALDWSDFWEGPDISVWATYQIVRCNGCDCLSFRSVHSDSESRSHGDYDEKECLYPERKQRSVVDELYLRDDVYDIPKIIQVIYRETLSAVEHGLPTIAGIGIRAVVEATCQDLKAKKRNLQDKIDELVDKSLLTPSGAEILHGIRELGNAAAHEMKAPTKKQITAALKVIDHLLLGAYVIPKEASVLPKSKPKSKPTKQSPKKARPKMPGKGVK
ncbi:MAG TPA: DUF4145 domain-containing protein [Candidatus Hydrogenedentes bacterium]|nr:DUF4145 domain-containing protein [Candidatus Hydrogenedentota bacterium]HPG66458.1 DUF4145 domain-containing protein [Candidatus Hydrogenedentota bacterium]